MTSERNSILLALGMGLLAGLLAALGIVVLSSTTAVAADEGTPDLLPGVDLVTEEVEPGVYRVLSDGVRDLTRRVQDVAVTPTGDVWVEQGTSRDWDIIRLGEPGVSRALGRERPWDLFTLDGAPTVTRPGLPAYPPIPWRTFDGESWVDHEPTGCDHQQRWGQGGITADGQCWWQLEPLGRGVYPIDDSGDAPRDDSGEARSVVLDGVGSTADRFMSSVDVTDDGTLWATVHSSETSKFEGLVRYDGETWEFIPYDAALEPEAGNRRRPESHIALGPDGRVWAVDIYHHPAGNKSAFVVRVWDGEDWMTLGPVEAPQRFGSPRTDARFLDDGSVWLLDGVLVVDDDGLRTQDLPGVPGDVEFGPDGSAWTIAGGALYVITPKAVAE